MTRWIFSGALAVLWLAIAGCSGTKTSSDYRREADTAIAAALRAQGGDIGRIAEPLRPMFAKLCPFPLEQMPYVTRFEHIKRAANDYSLDSPAGACESVNAAIALSLYQRGDYRAAIPHLLQVYLDYYVLRKSRPLHSTESTLGTEWFPTGDGNYRPLYKYDFSIPELVYSAMAAVHDARAKDWLYPAWLAGLGPDADEREVRPRPEQTASLDRDIGRYFGAEQGEWAHRFQRDIASPIQQRVGTLRKQLRDQIGIGPQTPERDQARARYFADIAALYNNAAAYARRESFPPLYQEYLGSRFVEAQQAVPLFTNEAQR